MILEQTAGARKPSSRLRNFAIQERCEAEPKRAPHRWFRASLTEERLMSASQKVRALRFSSNQQGSLRELGQILRLQWRLLVGHNKLGKGSSPRLSAKGVAALL